MQPIWRDYYVTLGNAASYTFRILKDGVQVYAGKAVKRPTETTIKIRINDICADSLGNQSVLSEQGFAAEAVSTYQVQTLSGSTWTTIDTIQFQNDWSYDDSYLPTMGLSFPINGKVDARQLLVISAYNQTTLSAVITFEDGSSTTISLPLSSLGSFNDDYNEDYEVSNTGSPTGVAVINLSDYPGAASVSVDGRYYSVIGSCFRYALYYINAFGGWDSLLIEGNDKEADSLTRHSYNRSYDNSEASARGRVNYLNEIAKSWTLYTGIMSDEQSLRMHHLLNSPIVFLYDIPQGRMMPVVLTDAVTEHKTFKNNAREVVTYTIGCELAQERVRR